MDRRQKLHEELCEVLGTRNVYFQPPESVKLAYPCILYSLSNVPTWRADDRIYFHKNRYSLTVVSRDPDSKVHEKLMEHFKFCSFDRAYVADNLYHKALSLHY